MDIASLSKCDIFRDIFTKINTYAHSKNTLMNQKKINLETDALLAVKMDPAVLEAQVTLDRGKRVENNTSTYVKVCADLKTQEPRTGASCKEQSGFEKAILMQEAALLSLSPEHFSLLLKYVDTLRKQRLTFQKKLECAFCKNNGQPEIWYTTHVLKDGKGRVRCPVLRALSCRRCGATGDSAHTIRYCPIKSRF